MSDKEAIEKIHNLLEAHIYHSLTASIRLPNLRGGVIVGQILQELEQLGYRKLPKDKPPECEHNWVFKGTRHESRNYGSWDIDIFYCSKCLAHRDGGASNQVGW